MARIEGVHLKGVNGKTYFIPVKALKLFEEPAGVEDELETTDVQLVAYQGSHPTDGEVRKTLAANFGIE